jgi:energy-converting hydrogenase Eha subunit A
MGICSVIIVTTMPTLPRTERERLIKQPHHSVYFFPAPFRAYGTSGQNYEVVPESSYIGDLCTLKMDFLG